MLPIRLIRRGLFGSDGKVDLPATPTLRSRYDVAIIGGGGHGLATAYFLASRYRVGRIAVIERSYIGGGNTGRNTQVIRANYTTPEAIRFYARSLELYRTLSEELDFNLMFSGRGQLTLAQTDAFLAAPDLASPLRRLLGEGRDGVVRAMRARARDIN